MASADFCHLHVHTEYSLLDGACRIAQIAEKATRLGMPAVAITDHGNMFGAVEFYNTLHAHDLKPILGYEAYFTSGRRTDRDPSKGARELFHLTFLAADQAGFKSLLKMASLAYVEGLYYKPRVDWDLLEDCAEGVICLSGCLHSRLNTFLLEGRLQDAQEWLGKMKDLFGPDRLYVELQDHGLEDQQRVLAPSVELAEKLAIPVAATNDCHYLEAGDRNWHDVLLAISTRTTLDDPDRFRMDSDQLYFKSAEEMARTFDELPQALSNTVRIAEMCEVELDTSRKYPTFRMEGRPAEENPQLLRSLTHQGLEEKYGALSPEMEERLGHELEIIEQTGYVDYTLICWDFVRFAREKNIPVGMRGSGAGSLVNHSLGITDINPMDYDLLFSRYLDPARPKPPDIDLDFCERRREEVISYVRERYGSQRVAQIITFGTLQARNCIRDVGRVLGVELKKVDRLAKMIPFGLTLEEAMEQAAGLRALAESDEQVPQIIEFALKLEGLPRHVSTHAAGVVITDQPLWELAPLYRTGDGEVMTQWAMDDLAKVGILKMDLLGLRTLTVVDRACQIIREAGREPPDLSVQNLDLGDRKTYELLSKGLTKGVFQLGSAGMQRLLKQLQPSNIEDIIAVVGLFRPGPLQSGMMDDFIQRRHGHAETAYPHPAFEPILKPTYGVLLYQEQIMRIANTIAGMSMGNAMTMIDAISKKNRSVIERRHKDFVEGAVANGLDRETAEESFELIRHFGGYGFNKAHTSAYAFLAFTTAYLKAHYPTEFMAASISCEMGDTDKVVSLMSECVDLGIEVLPPDINESRAEFTPLDEGKLRFGLGAVKNLGTKAIDCIVTARDKGGPFKSLFGFCERVDAHEVSRGALEALLKAGCFDSLPGERAQQLAALETAIKAGARARKNRQIGQRSLFGPVREEDPLKRMAENLQHVPPLSHRELAQQEEEALGLHVRYDPLVEHRDKLVRFCTAFADALENLAEGEEAIMGGMIEKLKRRTTRKRETMAVLQVLDVQGTFECVLFPATYERYLDVVEPGSVMFFAGHVGHEWGTSLNADEVIPFEKAQARLAGSVFVSVPCAEVDASLWPELRQVLQRNSGGTPVFIDLVGAGFMLRSQIANGAAVEASEQLAREIEGLVGAGNVRFGIQRRRTSGRQTPGRGTARYENSRH